MCWLALAHPGDTVTSRIAGDPSVTSSAGCATLVNAAFQDLAAGRTDRGCQTKCTATYRLGYLGMGGKLDTFFVPDASRRCSR